MLFTREHFHTSKNVEFILPSHLQAHQLQRRCLQKIWFSQFERFTRFRILKIRQYYQGSRQMLCLQLQLTYSRNNIAIARSNNIHFAHFHVARESFDLVRHSMFTVPLRLFAFASSGHIRFRVCVCVCLGMEGVGVEGFLYRHVGRELRGFYLRTVGAAACTSADPTGLVPHIISIFMWENNNQGT